METLPLHLSLVSQTSRILRTEIKKGGWEKWLPPERLLCANLRVSRNTLRAALLLLKEIGLIEARQGAGNQIVQKKSPSGKQFHLVDVALLAPDPLASLRPTLTLQIDELRAMLSERGIQLHAFCSRLYFLSNPEPLLRKLIAANKHSCWILLRSNPPIQRWFEQNSVPCVVAGSAYSGIALPFRDLDHRAICRHAAGLLLGLGHQKIALVIEKSVRAEDIESEYGFIEALHLSSRRNAAAVVCKHDATVEGMGRMLLRLMKQEKPPTAILVANPFHYLTVVTRLTQMGWTVPQQISVISRDDDSFLDFLVPSPARYVCNPHAVAKLLLKSVLDLLNGALIPRRKVLIMPDFVRGDTLKPPQA